MQFFFYHNVFSQNLNIFYCAAFLLNKRNLRIFNIFSKVWFRVPYKWFILYLCSLLFYKTKTGHQCKTIIVNFYIYWLHMLRNVYRIRMTSFIQQLRLDTYKPLQSIHVYSNQYLNSTSNFFYIYSFLNKSFLS